MKFTENDIDYDRVAEKQLDYLEVRNKRMLDKVDDIIDDILENGYGGGFHPEMLKGNLSGWCSKEVDKKNRVVFKIKDGRVRIAQVMGHYSDH
jgi:toxin YoeB